MSPKLHSQLLARMGLTPRSLITYATFMPLRFCLVSRYAEPEQAASPGAIASTAVFRKPSAGRDPNRSLLGEPLMGGGGADRTVVFEIWQDLHGRGVPCGEGQRSLTGRGSEYRFRRAPLAGPFTDSHDNQVNVPSVASVPTGCSRGGCTPSRLPAPRFSCSGTAVRHSL